jgi:hypothetical protein
MDRSISRAQSVPKRSGTVSVGGLDGGPIRVQTGVLLADVAAFMREHVPGFQAQLDEGEPAGEIVAEIDESIEQGEA